MDEFGAPASQWEKGVSDDGIELDRWDRYLLPHPLTGDVQPWTRATTLAKTLEDTYNLSRWQQRMVTRGVSLRPDLVALAASVDNPDTPDGRSTLNDIAKRALEAAGGTARRDTGSALHGFTARYDHGTAPSVPPHIVDDLTAYETALKAHQLVVLPRYIERVVCVPEWGTAGRVDRGLVRCPDKRYRVMDVKTGSTLDYGQIALVIQLSVYVRGMLYGYWNEGAWRTLPEEMLAMIDPEMGLVMHLPSGTGTAQLYGVDLREGAALAEAALAVREYRKRKNLIALLYAHPGTPAAHESVKALEAPEPPVAPVGQFDDLSTEELAVKAVRDAATVGELADLWTLLHPRGLWTVPVHETATARREELTRQDAERAEALARIARVGSTDEMTHLWEELHEAGLWTEEVAVAAEARQAELRSAAIAERIAAASSVEELSQIWQEYASFGWSKDLDRISHDRAMAITAAADPVLNSATTLDMIALCTTGDALLTLSQMTGPWDTDTRAAAAARWAELTPMIES